MSNRNKIKKNKRKKMIKRKDKVKIVLELNRKDIEKYCEETFNIWKNSYYRPTNPNGTFTDGRWRLVKKYLKLKYETHTQQLLTDKEGLGLDFVLQNIWESDSEEGMLMMMNNKELKQHISLLEEHIENGDITNDWDY